MDVQFFQTSKLWLPSYLARNLEKVLNAETPEESCRSMRDVFSLLMRTVTISLVSQYLFQKKDRVQDDNLNHMLANNLPELSMDACLQLLFASVRALGNQPQTFFIQEIYDLYWDTPPGKPYVYKANEEDLLRNMVQILSIVKDDKLASNNHVNWDKLNNECSDLLVKILEKFSFLQNYELIRVVGTGNSFWEVEVYKGMEVELSKVSGSGVSLQEGWFYWHHVESETFLRLNPFLVFWQDVVTGKDVAVFEAYVPERLQYLLTQLGKIVVDNAEEKEFEKLMEEIIQEAGSKPQEVQALEWEHLRKVCKRISQYGMGRNLHKYNPDLYVQRWHVFESFERFLASDKKIFVLVGNSGTGKSSFVLSLAEALKKDDKICTISYDGKQLKVEPSIQNAIAKDFNKFVMIDGEKSNDLWIEIGKVKGIENKQVVLFVDGINENTYPKELLGQLYQLANLNWSWLKIVLTCRPETWQKILTRQNMDEKLYYQEQDRNPTGGDRSFSYSIKLEAFSKNELEDVYEKYKRKYDLKTDLRNIKGRVQEILRDPFNLWLVSSTHQHQEIPDGLVVSDLVKVYVESLLKSGVLREKDIEFLREELVPLFFESDSRIVNELSRDDITTEDTNRGNLKRNDSKEEEYLYDRIRGEGVSSDGEPKTKSFTNLTDAHILLMDNEDSNWKIKFTHERFFEYFVGEQISRLSISRKDLVNYFQNLVIKTNQLTFLWGAVKHALVIEMGGPSVDTILKLCYTTEQRVKEMMVAVIIDFGSENLSKTEAFLEQLLPVSKQTGSLKRGQLILRRASLTYDIRNRNAQKIAVEVASKLQLAWVLQTGAAQKDPAVRTSAVRYGYYLWQQNPNEGYKILRQISKDALPGIIPNLVAFESFVVFSLVIFIDHFKNDEVLIQLRSIWSRNLIAKLFIRNESDGFVKRKLQSFVREMLFFNAIKMVMTIIKEFPQYAKAVNYSFIDAFFHLETREKELYKKLVEYLNAEGDYSTDQMKADYLAAIKTQCLLFQGVVILGLSVHALQNPGEFLPFLKHFFSEAEKDTPENIWVASIPTVLMTVLDQNAREKEYFEFFVQTAAKCQVFYTKHTPEAYYLGPYVLYQYSRTGNAETDWLKTRIEAQLKSNNLSFFDALINSELVIVGIEKHEPIAVLQVLGLFFAQSTQEIKQIIQTFLTRLKIYYPNEVDNFLEELKVPDDFRLSVRANETTETLGALIGGTKVWNFFLNVLSESSGFQKHLIHLFDKAANFSDAKKWIEYTIRYLFNLVFGG